MVNKISSQWNMVWIQMQSINNNIISNTMNRVISTILSSSSNCYNNNNTNNSNMDKNITNSTLTMLRGNNMQNKMLLKTVKVMQVFLNHQTQSKPFKMPTPPPNLKSKSSQTNQPTQLTSSSNSNNFPLTPNTTFPQVLKEMVSSNSIQLNSIKTTMLRCMPIINNSWTLLTNYSCNNNKSNSSYK